MFVSTRFALFLTAALLLAIAPGPGMLYVLARSLAGGKREGVLSALGTFLGGMVHVLAAALGVSIILAKSALAFATVKYLGAAYLCFLGVRMILDARREKVNPPEANAEDIPRECKAGAKSAMARRSDGGPQSQDGVVFSFLYSAIRESRERACLPAICCAGNDFGGDEHDGGPDCDRIGRTSGRTDSLLGNVSAPATNRNWRDHDWAGNLSRDQRE